MLRIGRPISVQRFRPEMRIPGPRGATVSQPLLSWVLSSSPILDDFKKKKKEKIFLSIRSSETEEILEPSALDSAWILRETV